MSGPHVGIGPPLFVGTICSRFNRSEKRREGQVVLQGDPQLDMIFLSIPAMHPRCSISFATRA